MSDELPRSLTLQRRWVRASVLGWLLGMVFGIGAAVLAESIGLPTTQSVLGFGMGAGLGLVQGRVVAPWVGGVRPWVVSTVVGMGAPFLVWDVSAIWVDVLSLPVCLGVGGLLTGFLQHRALARGFGDTGRWIGATVLAWLVLGGLVALNDLLRAPGPLRALPLFAVILVGGAILGAITGRVLARLPPREH